MLENAYLPEAVEQWIHDLGWEKSQIATPVFIQDMLPDGFTVGLNGQKWPKSKPGEYVTVRVQRGEEVRTQRFTAAYQIVRENNA